MGGQLMRWRRSQRSQTTKKLSPTQFRPRTGFVRIVPFQTAVFGMMKGMWPGRIWEIHYRWGAHSSHCTHLPPIGHGWRERNRQQNLLPRISKAREFNTPPQHLTVVGAKDDPVAKALFAAA